jgi:hypothetical protein
MDAAAANCCALCVGCLQATTPTAAGQAHELTTGAEIGAKRTREHAERLVVMFVYVTASEAAAEPAGWTRRLLLLRCTATCDAHHNTHWAARYILLTGCRKGFDLLHCCCHRKG